MAGRNSTKVYVFKRSRRLPSGKHSTSWQMEAVDVDGERRRRSCGPNIKTKRDADRLAAQWETELRVGNVAEPGRVPWDVFRRQFEDLHLRGLADKSAERHADVLNLFERLVKPATLASVTAQSLSRYVAGLRDLGRGETTIATHLSHLRTALNWAVEQGLLFQRPKLPKIARAEYATEDTPMKGRPLTLGEFTEMFLPAVEAVVGGARSPSWAFLLRGLFLGGQRLGEAMATSWDDQTRILVVQGRDGHLYLSIPPKRQKSHKRQLVPTAPEFEDLLRSVPGEARQGFVFNPASGRPDLTDRPGEERVGKVIRDIGEASGIIVNHETGKHASAHDLRRSFGDRWSYRVKPRALKELMRHTHISTTERYYVGRNAEATAAVLWAAAAETGFSAHSSDHPAEKAENHESSGL